MKVKATMTILPFGLIKEAIYDTEFTLEQKNALVSEGLAFEITDNEINQSVVDDWTAKVYPNGMLVIKDGSLYRANVGAGLFTSATWVVGEWTLKLQGL